MILWDLINLKVKNTFSRSTQKSMSEVFSVLALISRLKFQFFEIQKIRTQTGDVQQLPRTTKVTTNEYRHHKFILA